ncbi:MAG: HD domain-containing protein [Gammaproteobacteria bacterium]|nr:HD domain-containing protein [Gammaproteobacteria bacterium]MCW8927841.1 HD domain-containing protein [Gammaproteobacteria bacterium]MCW8957597.1 HD domain-containing protein [Gammaproteobacteria bacterium]MCW8973647.1 HD domain-containing protein [Gammaproteobacteria bacterium]MCW8991675.1 HD domain-containing protein [Gammaproteobacteria bacterium]
MNAKTSSLLEHPLIKVDLRQAVLSLAEALSLVGIDEHQHGERVAYMAMICAQKLGWDGAALDDLFHAALLHDCGVSSSTVHKKLIAEMDWEGAELHCVLGEYYLKGFPPLSHLTPIIRYHHTHWRELRELPLAGNIALASNLIYMVDRVDALKTQLQNSQDVAPLAVTEQIRSRISDAAGEHFSPELVDAFLTVSDNDVFWLTLEPLHLAGFLASVKGEGKTQLSHYEDIHKLARIFAHIVDAKSSFTFDHSLGVAQVARHLATLLELPQPRVALIELAGLLHDLGKLGVPDEILEKPGPLDAQESAIMHRHSYETFRILSHIEGFEQIAEWAGSHHETLVGDGYPFQREETELCIEARIIAVADIFQALAQERPYRAALQAEAILAQLQQLADAGKIDAALVQLVEQNLESVWQAATSDEGDWMPTLVD